MSTAGRNVSHWRQASRRIINEVLADLATVKPDATEKEKRKAVQNAYPFGLREMHPYKCWLMEVRLALAKKIPTPNYKVMLTINGLDCDWCVNDGCLSCLRLRHNWNEAREHLGFREWMFALLMDNDGVLEPVSLASGEWLAFCDWLEDQGFEALANAGRA
jgi:hypothetical protein